jgi:hypothetical protein
VVTRRRPWPLLGVFAASGQQSRERWAQRVAALPQPVLARAFVEVFQAEALGKAR